MDLPEAIITKALDNTDLTDLVGQNIFWGVRTQKSALPAVVLNFAGGEPEDLDLEDEADSDETRVQFSALASTADECVRILAVATLPFISSFGVDDFQFWGGQRERPIGLGSDTTPQGFIHEVSQDVTLRHTRV